MSDEQRPSLALVTAALLATYMQTVNISLPNAALLQIQGGLSMSDDEVGWVFSAYIAASVITMPMTRWLAGRFGRKIIYQSLTAVFALGLILAAQSGTPLQFIGARILQGAASGPLAPLSLAILLDILPPRLHARISQVWTVTAVLGIVSGPSIGGWVAEYPGWPALFYLSLPIVGFILLAAGLSLSEKKAAQSPAFDFFGFGSFALGMTGLQMMLDRGERLEWFCSPEIWAEAAASALGFYTYLVHMLTVKTHFLNKALFRDRNFVLSSIMFFAFGFVLLPTMALTSPMLDELLNYPAATTGFMAIPRSIALLAALLFAERFAARIGSHKLVAAGSMLTIYANWRMLGYAPGMDWRPVIIAGIIQGAGLGMLMAALTKTAFSTLDPAHRPEGTMLFNLSRLYGSTIGIALVQIFLYDNTQAMHLTLAKDLVSTSNFSGSLTALNEMITRQAAFVGVIGQFKLMMIVMLIATPLVIFLRKPQPAT
jgi:DHA2 family multidrug resistance protein